MKTKIFIILFFISRFLGASEGLLNLNFQSQVVKTSGVLTLGDILQKEKTSPQIIQRFSGVSLEGCQGGTLQVSRVLTLLQKQGLDLDQVSVGPPSQIEIIENTQPDSDSELAGIINQKSEKQKLLISLVIAKHSMAMGDVVSMDDFEEQKKEVETSSGLIPSLSAISGKRLTLTKNIQVGDSLKEDDFQGITNPKKGDMVTLFISSKEFKIQTLGRVKDVQESGNRVLVENFDSKKEVWGKALNSSEVEIVF